jgi:uncharacterized protein (TIGR03437 family)
LLFGVISLALAGQTAPLTLPVYDMYRYAVAGQEFRYRFAAGGGVGPYAYALEEGSTLPPGTSLDGTTGELAGTIPRVGEFRHTVCVTDQTSARICVPFLVIAVANAEERYTELPPARVAVDYQNLIAPPGVFAEVAYDPISGAIPPGMVLEITGRLYGIPRAPGGAWAFKVRGRDFAGEQIVRSYLIRALGPLAATTVMPTAYAGLAYQAQFTVLGDQPPHVWTVRRGPLPPGLVLEENGRISGVCNLAGRYAFALRVTDPTGSSHDREMILDVGPSLPPLTITTTALPGAILGAAYRQQVGIGGGRAPYTLRANGALPPGLTMSAGGLLTGTPTALGTYTFTVQLSDVTGNFVLRTFSIVVGNLRYAGPETVSAYVSEETDVALTAEGGTAPYRWAVVTGSVPAGLALSEDGRLRGTAAGTGTAALLLRLTDGAGRTVEFPVRITVNPARPLISEGGVVNGASYAAAGITPGQVVTLFGVRMGPATLAPFLLDSSGRVPGALAGTRVLFAGLPAPLLYVSAGQIGAIVPFGVTGRTTVDVEVDANGVRSPAVTLPVVASAPGLFTADATGKGQAAALNQDGTLNGRGMGVRAGEVLVLYGTGEGQTLPLGQDGAVTGSDTPRPVQPVRVTIGGKEGVVLYAGAAPGLVAGVFQLNVRVPADVASGDAVPVVVRVGENASAEGVTVVVR